MSTVRTAALIAAALVLSASACRESAGGKESLPPASGSGAPPLPALPALVHPDTKEPAVSASTGKTTGTLVARSEVEVAPRASGTIVEIKVDEGDRVTRGDLLFRLDGRDATLAKQRADLALRGAQVQLATAENEHARAKALFEQNAMPRQQWDQIQAQVESARVAVAQAQNAVAMAQKAIADTVVRAPLDGIVLSKRMSEGEYATMMPPSPVVVLQDQSVLELRFRLNERALVAIHAGDKVTVQLPAMGVTRTATIARVAPMIDPRTRTLEMVALLDNADGALKPGLMAEVIIGDAKAPAASPPEKAKEQAKEKAP